MCGIKAEGDLIKNRALRDLTVQGKEKVVQGSIKTRLVVHANGQVFGKLDSVQTLLRLCFDSGSTLLRNCSSLSAT